MFLSYLTLAVALSLSMVAAWYSIIGLTAIFASAVIPIIIMGGILEVAKITVTLWLHQYWAQCRLLMKMYLVPAVAMLMLITSMGIFGFLSKAHLDQAVPIGDVAAKLSVYDEKIKTSRDNIDANRKALKQMDEAVDQVMGRSSDEKGADKAVQIRRGQQKERARLQAEITAEQKTIGGLNEERAPIATEVRKVEAEVGPIKYIAALIYGDGADNNALEQAVRWVIIILVVVFDPLAIMMVLASTESLKWERLLRAPHVVPKSDAEPDQNPPDYPPDDGPLTADQITQIQESAAEPVLPNCYKCNTPLINAAGIGPFCPNKDCDVVDGPFVDDSVAITIIPAGAAQEKIEATEESTEDLIEETPAVKAAIKRWKADNPNDTIKNQRHMLSRGEIQQLPWLEPLNEPVTGFGREFPKTSKRGDTFVKTDQLPTCLYKYNGAAWIAIDKDSTDSYTYNTAYIDHLIEKLGAGEYEQDLLSASEYEQVEQRLKSNT